MADLRRLRWSVWKAPTKLALVGAVLLLAGLVARGSCDDQPAGVDAVAAGTLEIGSAESIEAGSPWQLSVHGTDIDRLTAELWGPWGVRRIDAEVEDGVLEIPADLTTISGRLSVFASTGSASARTSVEVVAGRAVDGIVPLAGPRSMVADGSHWTMVTAIPVDRFGNPVTDGTPVRLHVRRPDGTIDLIDTETAHLLAGVRVFSGTLAGRSTIRVSVDGATGPEVEVLEVPGPPASVELSAPDQPLRADGRMLVSVATAPLEDRYGNMLLDGTAVSVAVKGPGGSGALTAVTIEGRAEFVIEAPPIPGVVEVSAEVAGVMAQPLQLEFVTDVLDLAASLHRVSDGDRSSVVLAIGPVLTGLGGFVPDGTLVTVTTPLGEVTAESRDGRAEIAAAADRGEILVVEVLGTRIEVVAP